MPLSIAIDQGLPAVPHSWAGLQFGHVDSVITQKVQTLEQGPLLINSSKNERGFAVDLRITDNRSFADNQKAGRSEEHTSELQSRGHLVCRLLLEKKKKYTKNTMYKQKINN